MENNPGAIGRPNLNSPIASAIGSLRKEKKNKGNRPWLNARKKLRKDIFR